MKICMKILYIQVGEMICKRRVDCIKKGEVFACFVLLTYAYCKNYGTRVVGDKIEIFFNDTASPALIKDPSDFDSIFVVMPMKG